MSDSPPRALRMNVTPKVIGYAIHGILVAHKVGVGCSLPLRVFMETWPETGLRKPDLGQGIGALREAGAVRLENTDEGVVVRVLDEHFGLVLTDTDRKAVETLRKLRDARRRPATLLTGQAPIPQVDRRKPRGA